jgi:hypothetical protein
MLEGSAGRRDDLRVWVSAIRSRSLLGGEGSALLPDGQMTESRMNLIKFLGVLFVAAQRLRARRVARWWIQELDSLGDDWDAADALWKFIELWLNAHPVNCQEFLKLFRASRDVQETSSVEPFLWPQLRSGRLISRIQGPRGGHSAN